MGPWLVEGDRCSPEPWHASTQALCPAAPEPAWLLLPSSVQAEAALDQGKFSQLEALLNRSQMYTQFLTEQVFAGACVCGSNETLALLARIHAATLDSLAWQHSPGG